MGIKNWLPVIERLLNSWIVESNALLKFFERVSSNIDDLTVKAGKISSWIILAMILAQFTWLIFKNIFGMKLISFFELSWLSLGLLILAGSAYNLISNKHLKIENFSKNISQQKQAIINILGALFFVIPTAALIFGLSWNYFVNELSQNQFLFALQAFSDPSSLRIISLSVFISIITVFTQLTALAAISIACKAVLKLQNLKSLNFVKSAEKRGA
ncbi:MAG: TRAP transporter small permease subunit [Rhodomicrobiaceae bacterium]